MDIKKTLFEFTQVNSTSGAENNAVEYAMKALAPYGKVVATPLKSVICTVKEPEEGKPHIMLEAHMDEIGLIVTHIDDNGFLKVSNIGGVDRNSVMAAPVTIHTSAGEDIKAVVCSIPPHLSDDQSKLPKISEISIDTGLSAEEVKAKIHLGDRITFDSVPAEMLNNTVTCKAQDDRACCVIMLRALELLKDAELNCGLSVVFASMEEVGGHGAKTAAYTVNPTHAIVSDVSFAYTPDVQPHQVGKVGKGGLIGYASLLSDEMSNKLVALGDELNIPYQVEPMGGYGTGTDADEVATTRNGVKTALISLPQKYMHTIIETISLDDMENTAKLIAEYVKTLR